MSTVPADNGKAMAWGLAITLALMYTLLLGYMIVAVDWFPSVGALSYIPVMFGANWFAKKVKKIEYEDHN